MVYSLQQQQVFIDGAVLDGVIDVKSLVPNDEISSTECHHAPFHSAGDDAVLDGVADVKVSCQLLLQLLQGRII